MRIARPVWVCAGLLALQLWLFVTFGVLHQVRGAGVLFVGLLLFGLARRWRLAWALLVLLFALPALAIALSFDGSAHTMWSHVIIMALTSIAIEWSLWSPAMREHMAGHAALQAQVQ